MADGERDLKRLLSSLEPKLSEQRFTFAKTIDDSPGGAFALIREDEGLCAIREDADGAWARISLGLHSSLDAVGLTAVLSRALADARISANIIAGLRHDHLFVPWGRRDEALALIRGLA